MLDGSVQHRVGAQLRVDPQAPSLRLELGGEHRRAASFARLHPRTGRESGDPVTR